MVMNDLLTTVLSVTGEGVVIRVKVVPGSSRTKLSGILGDRLKVCVSAPPEAGKANRAVCDLFADLLNVPHRDVIIYTGVAQPLKAVHVFGVNLCQITERLGQLLDLDTGH